MASIIRVASPPAKAMMIYDGECDFCTRWIRRWQQSNCDQVEYLPFQDPSVAARFPEVPRGRFERAVQLVEKNGSVYSGAEAIFRGCAHHRRYARLLSWYARSVVFARVAEWGYQLVARHRGFFSALTRWVWRGQFRPK
ncbi:MAG: DCC1-like thiol-disulfide oxidoreductase family protein [Verrucomicrobia bacterium]|nr:DCC1-like thiol-disulfide oxidoreductase family protein [Verrucomicrobiota bacterium]